MNSMNKLTDEKCKEEFEKWLKSTGQNPPYATKRGYWEIWKASREALEEQGGGGWIEWDGNRAPFNAGEIVQIRLKDGDVDTGPWSHFHWGRNCMNPIIAYRIISGQSEVNNHA